MSTKCSDMPVRVVPILEEAVVTVGMEAVLEILGMISEARAQDDAMHAEYWAAMRDRLYSIVYPMPDPPLPRLSATDADKSG